MWSDGTTSSVKLTWKIKPAKITSVTAADQAYTGKAIKAKPTVKAGKLTVPAAGYAASYANNVKAGTATVTAKGKGNFTGVATGEFKIKAPSVQYYVHRQTYGWETRYCNADGDQSGTTGEGKRLEGIYVRLNKKPVSGSIQYRTHIQTYGWEKDWKNEGEMSGTFGESKRLEAIQIRLTGEMAKKYDVWYRVHAQTYGWMGWTKNGASAGTAGQGKRLETIQIVILPKGSTGPATTLKGAKQTTASAFVQKK